jgi:hypothetical protein
MNKYSFQKKILGELAAFNKDSRGLRWSRTMDSLVFSTMFGWIYPKAQGKIWNRRQRQSGRIEYISNVPRVSKRYCGCMHLKRLEGYPMTCTEKLVSETYFGICGSHSQSQERVRQWAKFSRSRARLYELMNLRMKVRDQSMTIQAYEFERHRPDLEKN